MIKQYRKKPVVVDAVLLTEDNRKEVAEWIVSNGGQANVLEWEDNMFMIDTLEGRMKADLGDYIIKGVKGEFYPCKPDIFESTYDEVSK